MFMPTTRPSLAAMAILAAPMLLAGGAQAALPLAPVDRPAAAEAVLLPDGTATFARRGRGADDPAGHNAGDDRGRQHGGHGADDAPNHG